MQLESQDDICIFLCFVSVMNKEPRREESSEMTTYCIGDNTADNKIIKVFTNWTVISIQVIN